MQPLGAPVRIRRETRANLRYLGLPFSECYSAEEEYDLGILRRNEALHTARVGGRVGGLTGDNPKIISRGTRRPQNRHACG